MGVRVSIPVLGIDGVGSSEQDFCHQTNNEYLQQNLSFS